MIDLYGLFEYCEFGVIWEELICDCCGGVIRCKVKWKILNRFNEVLCFN